MIKPRSKRYKPNEIPLKDRVLCCVLSLIMIVYGTVAYFRGGLYIPARRGGSTFHGVPMYIMLAAMALATVAMFIVVIDHYDRRDNEKHYKLISRVVQGMAWTCFFSSIVVSAIWK